MTRGSTHEYLGTIRAHYFLTMVQVWRACRARSRIPTDRQKVLWENPPQLFGFE